MGGWSVSAIQKRSHEKSENFQKEKRKFSRAPNPRHPRLTRWKKQLRFVGVESAESSGKVLVILMFYVLRALKFITWAPCFDGTNTISKLEFYYRIGGTKYNPCLAPSTLTIKKFFLISCKGWLHNPNLFCMSTDLRILGFQHLHSLL